MELQVKITGDGRGAQQAIRGVTGDLRGLDQGLASVASSVPGLGSALGMLANPAALAGAAFGATVAAAGAMGAALAQAVADTVSFGDGVGDLSAQLGIGAESLQTLQYAAERSGGSADALRSAVKALTKSMAEAQDDGSKTAATFAAIGVSTRDATGAMRPIEDVLRDTIGALGEVGNQTEQAALAGDLLGKSYQDLTPLIKAGAVGMAELEQRARDLGGVMSNEDVEAAGKLDDALVDLKFATQGLWHEIGGALIPTLTTAATGLLDMVKSGDLARGMMLGLEVAAIAAVSAIPMIGPALSALIPSFASWATSADDVATSLGDDLFRPLSRLPPAMTAVTTSVESSAHAAARARVEWDQWLETMGSADTGIDLESASAGWTAIADEQAAAMARRNADLGSFLDAPGAEIDLGATAANDTVALSAIRDQEEEATRRAQQAQEDYAASIQATGQAAASATTQAGDLFATIIDGANKSNDKTLTLTAQIVRLGTQIVAQIMTSATAGIAAAASTASAQASSNAVIATSGGIAGAVQATATYGASAGAGAAAFIGALASTGAAVASFIAGIADAGVGPDQLRKAGLLRHTVLAVRNDERVLSPSSTSAVDEMLEAWRSGDRVGGQSQSVSLRTSVVLDGREIGYAVDEHLITSTERGRSYRDRMRQPWADA